MCAPIYAFAALLLTAPEFDPVPSLNEAGWKNLRPVIRGLAIQWEILDAREDRLQRPEHFTIDIQSLRRRFDELADAPHLHDCCRFPTRAVVGQMLDFNQAYKQHLECLRPLLNDQGDTVRAAIRETNQLHRIWEKVYDARSGIYYVSVRRNALKQLREMVGVDAYYTGQLPPHVPVWRFQEIK
jgi:hypothetical protein